MCARLAIVVLVGLAAACGSDNAKSPPVQPQRVSLTIWNSSQRPLEEVRVHSGTEYLSATNLLTAPLPDDDRTLVDIFSGQHVTVIRRNVDGGQRIAFTTAQGLYLPTSGYVLQVFQESFRLHEPDLADGLPPDGGDAHTDGGPNDGGGPTDGGDTTHGDDAPADGGDP
jgi:hypothetical protein